MADEENKSGLPGEGDPRYDARAHTERNQDQQELANDPEHYRQEPEDRAHGTHGKGFSDETRVDDAPITTGDRDTLRQAQDPEAFKRTADKGNMGGAGWGNEAAGGSSVDKRPP